MSTPALVVLINAQWTIITVIFSVYFVFDRAQKFYILEIYLPSFLIVMVSWMSFMIPFELAAPRTTLTITTVLTTTTMWMAIERFVEATTVCQLKCSLFKPTATGIIRESNRHLEGILPHLRVLCPIRVRDCKFLPPNGKWHWKNTPEKVWAT